MVYDALAVAVVFNAKYGSGFSVVFNFLSGTYRARRVVSESLTRTFPRVSGHKKSTLGGTRTGLGWFLGVLIFRGKVDFLAVFRGKVCVSRFYYLAWFSMVLDGFRARIGHEKEPLYSVIATKTKKQP